MWSRDYYHSRAGHVTKTVQLFNPQIDHVISRYTCVNFFLHSFSVSGYVNLGSIYKLKDTCKKRAKKEWPEPSPNQGPKISMQSYAHKCSHALCSPKVPVLFPRESTSQMQCNVMMHCVRHGR